MNLQSDCNSSSSADDVSSKFNGCAGLAHGCNRHHIIQRTANRDSKDHMRCRMASSMVCKWIHIHMFLRAEYPPCERNVRRDGLRSIGNTEKEWNMSCGASQTVYQPACSSDCEGRDESRLQQPCSSSNQPPSSFLPRPTRLLRPPGTCKQDSPSTHPLTVVIGTSCPQALTRFSLISGVHPVPPRVRNARTSSV